MTLMVFLVLVIGSISFRSLKLTCCRRSNPRHNGDHPWPGASASDVEQRITKVMENSLSMLEGVDDLISRSLDNISVVSVKFKWGVDLDVRAGDVRDAVNFAKRELPSDAEESVVLRITSGTVPVVEVALTAERSYQGLYHFVDKNVVEELSGFRVGQVDLRGVAREIQVSSADRLEAYGLSPDAIAGMLERRTSTSPRAP